MDNQALVRYEAECLVIQIEAGCFDETDIYLSEEEKIQDIYLLRSAVTKEDFYKSKVYRINQEMNDKTIKKLSGKNEANTAPPCPKCGSERYKVTAQRRASDEPMNHEITCPSCSAVEYK